MEASSQPQSSSLEDTGLRPARPEGQAGIAVIVARLMQPITLDLRSLAVLRLALAGILLFHFSTASVSAFVDGPAHLATVAVLILGLPIALLLLAGYRSRLMALLSLGVVVAVHGATSGQPPFVNLTSGPGAAALVLMLFMAALLPIGIRYSLDSVVNTTPPAEDRHVSAASLALIVLFIAINLGPMIWSPPHPFAGPQAVAAPDAPAATLPANRPPPMPPTLTAAHLRTVPWLPASIPGKISFVTIAALILLIVPVFQGVLRGVATVAMAVLHLLIAADFPFTLLPLVLAAGWLALAPVGLWDATFNWLRTPPRMGLTIWYHRRDPAHLRRVRLLSTFLLIPETPLRPSDENVDIDVYRRQRDSWVVTDHQGYRYNRFRAFAAVCRASPLVFPLAVIFRSGFVEPIGDWLYDLGKRHRGPLTRLADGLRFRAISPRIPLWQQVAALVAVVLILAWRMPLAGWQ